jgi:Immunity protein 44
MKFFITSEAYKTVGKKMSDVYTQISPKINTNLKEKNLGSGVSDWGHICISCPPDVYDSGFFKEIKKYRKSSTEVELRLRIDYEEMLKVDEKGVFKLICSSILSGVDIAEHELKIKDFEFSSFRNILTKLFKEEGWI